LFLLNLTSAFPAAFISVNAYWPLILYFHGNGEVVSDYDQIAPSIDNTI